jgi:membrane associated rhomboid family serine protease
MRGLNFWQTMLIGAILVIVGALIPWLMVLGVIPSSFLLGFVSIGASVVGVILGFIGSAFYVYSKRKEREK